MDNKSIRNEYYVELLYLNLTDCYTLLLSCNCHRQFKRLQSNSVKDRDPIPLKKINAILFRKEPGRYSVQGIYAKSGSYSASPWPCFMSNGANSGGEQMKWNIFSA